MIQKLPIHVSLLTDESLSSWLIRIALEHGCDPLVLTGNIWPKWRIWTTDLDRQLTTAKCRELALVTGAKESLIQQAFLSHWAQSFSSMPLPKHGIWPWVLALGVRNRTYRGGVQFCPLCFHNDTRPYFRRYWRFAWVTSCLEHNIQLVDRCPSCKIPIEPHRLEAINAQTLNFCSSCHFNLSHSPSEEASKEISSFQYQAFSNLISGNAEINQKSVSTNQWFDACHYLIILIKRSKSLPHSSLAKAIYESGLHELYTQPAFNFQLELLSVQARKHLITNLHQLLNNIDVLTDNLKLQNVTKNSLISTGYHYPSSLGFLLDNLFMNKRKSPKSRTPSARIKSKSAVLKAWAQLKRKYRI